MLNKAKINSLNLINILIIYNKLKAILIKILKIMKTTCNK